MWLNDRIWIIMQHSRSWSAFTLDAISTVINLIYVKNLSTVYQLSILSNYLQKKEYKFR